MGLKGKAYKREIKYLLNIINTYQVDFLKLNENHGDYVIEKENEELFRGNLKGCMDYLEDYRLQLYEYSSNFGYLMGKFNN